MYLPLPSQRLSYHIREYSLKQPMNTMETDKGQGDLIGTWYQEKPKNSDEFCIMSAMTAEMTLNTERHL